MAQLAGEARAGSPRASGAAPAPAAGGPLAGRPGDAAPPGGAPGAAPAAGGGAPPGGGAARPAGAPLPGRDSGTGAAPEQAAADEAAVARFLRSTPGLPRALVGDLLGELEPRCLRVLDAFTRSFDFRGARLCETSSLKQHSEIGDAILPSQSAPAGRRALCQVAVGWGRGPAVPGLPAETRLICLRLGARCRLGGGECHACWVQAQVGPCWRVQLRGQFQLSLGQSICRRCSSASSRSCARRAARLRPRNTRSTQDGHPSGRCWEPGGAGQEYTTAAQACCSRRRSGAP